MSEKRGKLLTEAIYGFFAGITALLEQRVRDLVKEEERKALRSIALSVVFFTGALFALNGLAILIGESLEIGRWSGYGLVGLSLIIIGLIFRK